MSGLHFWEQSLNQAMYSKDVLDMRHRIYSYHSIFQALNENSPKFASHFKKYPLSPVLNQVVDYLDSKGIVEKFKYTDFLIHDIKFNKIDYKELEDKFCKDLSFFDLVKVNLKSFTKRFSVKSREHYEN